LGNLISLLGGLAREFLEDTLDPEVGHESEENQIQFTQIQNHLEGPRSWMTPRSKTRELGPWYCRKNMAICHIFVAF